MFQKTVLHHEPFPHVIVDDFLDQDLASQVLEEYPEPILMPLHADNMQLKGWKINPLGSLQI